MTVRLFYVRPDVFVGCVDPVAEHLGRAAEINAGMASAARRQVQASGRDVGGALGDEVDQPAGARGARG